MLVTTPALRALPYNTNLFGLLILARTPRGSGTTFTESPVRLPRSSFTALGLIVFPTVNFNLIVFLIKNIFTSLDTVGVGIGVPPVSRLAGVLVGDGVKLGLDVAVGLGDDCGVLVADGVAVGVADGTDVAVAEAVAVAVGVDVGEEVGVLVRVAVGVLVGVGVILLT